MNKNIVLSLMLLQSLSMMGSFDDKGQNLRISTATPFSVAGIVSPMPEDDRLIITPRSNKTPVRAVSPLMTESTLMMKENRARALSGLGQSLEDENSLRNIDARERCVEYVKFCFLDMNTSVEDNLGLIRYIASNDDTQLIPLVKAQFVNHPAVDTAFVRAVNQADESIRAKSALISQLKDTFTSR